MADANVLKKSSVVESPDFMTGQTLIVDGGRRVQPSVDVPSMETLPSR